MLVTKRMRVGQSKEKVDARDIYAASNDNETEQVSSLVVGRAGIGRVEFECWGVGGRVATEVI